MTTTCDAGQAYEQTCTRQAVWCMFWVAAWVWVHTGEMTVTVFRERRGASRLGGSCNRLFDFRAAVVVMYFVEIGQYFYLILGITLIQLGDSIWGAPGVTIGNPFGRIALAAVSGWEEWERDKAWKEGRLKEKIFNRLARMGFTREEVFAILKYADGNSADSLICCRRCVIRWVRGTYSANYEEAEHDKFLDMIQYWAKSKPGCRPTYVIKPHLKNRKYVTGEAQKCPTTSTAPWWQPYSTLTLAGVFWGYALRFRDILPRMRDRPEHLGIITAEYVLRGYKVRLVRDAWGRIPWCAERQEMLSRLSCLWKRRLPTEGCDLLGGELIKKRLKQRPGGRSRRRRTSEGAEIPHTVVHTAQPEASASNFVIHTHPHTTTTHTPQQQSSPPLSGSMAANGAGGGGGHGAHGQPSQGGGQGRAYWNPHTQSYHYPSAPGQGRKKRTRSAGAAEGGGAGAGDDYYANGSGGAKGGGWGSRATSAGGHGKGGGYWGPPRGRGGGGGNETIREYHHYHGPTAGAAQEQHHPPP